MAKKTRLTANSRDSQILKDSLELMKKKKFPGEDIDAFADELIPLLDFLYDQFGPDYELRYKVRYRMNRVQAILYAEGPNVSYTGIREEEESIYQILLRMLLSFMSVNTTENYMFDCNIFTVTSPVKRRKKLTLASPLLWSVVFGIIGGLICRSLPEGVKPVILYDLIDPLSSLVMGLITSIMGPVIFFSMISSITTLETINRLTDLGFKIMGRFLRITLFIIAVSIGVSLLFYSTFGNGTVTIEFGQLVRMFLDLIPQNIITPFAENNTPQLVILGFVMGAALLILGDKASTLSKVITEIKDWFMVIMEMIYVLTPAIPFFSLFKSFAEGSEQKLLGAWEFILAVFLAQVIYCTIKLIKVSLRCKISAPVLLRKLMPMMTTAFSAGSEAAAMNLQIEQSRTSLGVKQEFSDFWIPMSQAMLRPRTTVHLTVAPFLVSKYTGLSISQAFLLVLTIMTLELSVASAGITSAWIILFASLNLPMEYVGVFVIYKVFTTHFGAAGSMLYYGLEEIEAAHKNNALDLSFYQTQKTS